MTAEPAKKEHRVFVGTSLNDRLTVTGAAAGGICAAVVLAVSLGLGQGAWAFLSAYLWFLAIYLLLVWLNNRGPAIKDRFWAIMLWSAGVITVGVLGIILIFVSTQGAKQLVHPNFWVQDMAATGPLDPLTQGGIAYAIVATLEQIGIALIITVPLSLLTAVFLNEVGGGFAKFVRTIVEAMTALPSVVAGLFIYAAVVVPMHGQTGFAAALAIAVLMLPVMTRSADSVLRLVPGNLREAALGLGASQWNVVRFVVLPTVRSGLVTAMILGTAHGIGETAPAMLTAGFTKNMNWNPFQNQQTPLPLVALEFIKSSETNDHIRGYATATVLLILVLILFFAARIIGGQAAGQQGPRQARAAARASQAAANRMQTLHQRIAAEAATEGPSATSGSQPTTAGDPAEDFRFFDDTNRLPEDDK